MNKQVIYDNWEKIQALRPRDLNAFGEWEDVVDEIVEVAPDGTLRVAEKAIRRLAKGITPAPPYPPSWVAGMSPKDWEEAVADDLRQWARAIIHVIGS